MRRAAIFCLLLCLPCGLLAQSSSSDEERPFEKKYKLRSTGGRPDPFTIWEPQVVPVPQPPIQELGRETPIVIVSPEGSGTRTPQPRVDDLTRAVQSATADVERAYANLLNYHYQEVINACDKALKTLEDAGAPAGSVEERAMRIRKAAERLKLRKEVEEKFKKLPITIQGIVWQPENAFAVINGRMAQEGQWLQDAAARVYEILPQEVVFVFQGIKVSKRLFEGGSTDVPKKQPEARRK